MDCYRTVLKLRGRVLECNHQITFKRFTNLKYVNFFVVFVFNSRRVESIDGISIFMFYNSLISDVTLLMI